MTHSNRSTNANATVAQFDTLVDALIEARPLPTVEARGVQIEILNTTYLALTDSNLPSYMLSKLADWILLETLNDKDVDKVTNNEFAILSHRQLKRRDRRESSTGSGVMDYLHLKFNKRTDSLAKKSNHSQSIE